MSPWRRLLANTLYILCLMRAQQIASSDSCMEDFRQIWSRDGNLDGVVPNASFPVLTKVLQADDLHGCLRTCSGLSYCASFVHVDGETACYVMARLFTVKDKSSGLFQRRPKAVYFYDPSLICAIRADYTYFAEFGVCLKPYLTPLSWDEARLACQKEGADLTTAKTPEKRNLVWMMDANEGLQWVGAWSANGTALWVDGTPVTSNFTSMGPDNLVRNFFVQSQFQLLSGNMALTFDFVCEIVVG